MIRKPRISARFFTCAALLSLTVAGCAGSSRMSGPDLYVGTWSGTFEASQFGGTMSMTLAWSEEGWTGTITMGAMDEFIDGDVLSFEFEDSSCTFTSFVEGGDLVFKGAVEEGKMTGTFEVFVEGEYADGGVFDMTRQ